MWRGLIGHVSEWIGIGSRLEWLGVMLEDDRPVSGIAGRAVCLGWHEIQAWPLNSA